MEQGIENHIELLDIMMVDMADMQVKFRAEGVTDRQAFTHILSYLTVIASHVAENAMKVAVRAEELSGRLLSEDVYGDVDEALLGIKMATLEKHSHLLTTLVSAMLPSLKTLTDSEVESVDFPEELIKELALYKAALMVFMEEQTAFNETNKRVN